MEKGTERKPELADKRSVMRCSALHRHGHDHMNTHHLCLLTQDPTRLGPVDTDMGGAHGNMALHEEPLAMAAG